MRDRRRAARLFLAWWGVLVLVLGGSSVVDAHPSLGASGPSPLEFEADIPSAALAPVGPAPSNASKLITLAILMSIAGASLLRHPRRLAVVLALLLVVFAFESALHSAHHLNAPQTAERCPVYSASLHLTGLPTIATASECPPVVSALRGSGGRALPGPSPVLNGPPPRAPPVRPT